VAFAKAQPEFAALNAQLLGLSIDSNPSHLAWTYAIYVTSGVQIPFPVVADRMGDIAGLYGMISPNVSTQETVRNVFLIDPDQIVRAILIYPLTNGRSIPEILRLLIALQTTDKYHVVTPADWEPGEPALVPAPRTYDELLERQNNPGALNLSCEDWFWCYRELGPAQNGTTNSNQMMTTNPTRMTSLEQTNQTEMPPTRSNLESMNPTEMAPIQMRPTTQTTQTQVAPTEMPPTQTAPMQTTQTQTSPTNMTTRGTMPVTTPMQTTPTQMSPTRTAPTQMTPAQTTQPPMSPTNLTTTQSTMPQMAPTQTPPTPVNPAQGMSSQMIQTRTPTTQTIPMRTNTTQTNPLSSTPQMPLR